MCDDGNNVSGDGCRDDCASDETCGNGIVDNHQQMDVREECDPPGSVLDCNEDLGQFRAGVATCTSTCQLDLSECEVGCGNGVIEEVEGQEEECDGNDLGGLTCDDLGFAGGDLACAPGCELELASCTGGCGNEIAEPGEDCDGQDLRAMTCTDLGYAGGSLGCTSECNWDTQGCEGLVYEELSIDATSLTARVTGSTAGEASLLTASCQPNGGPELLYQVEVAQAGYYLFTTLPLADPGALADTILSMVANPENAPQAEELACNDNDGQSRHGALMIRLEPEAQVRYLAVEGYDGEQGAFDLLARGVATPSGTCADPVVLGEQGTHGALIDWTLDDDLQTGSCVGAASPEAVFSYTTQSATNVRLFAESIGDRPFGLYVRTGGCGETAQEEVCATGDYSGIERTIMGLSAGEQIHIIVEANPEDARVPIVIDIQEGI
jgi:hypothetical protein